MAGEGVPIVAPLSALQLLTRMKSVDGAGSGLDADLLDGLEGAAYVNVASTQTVSGDKTFTGAVIVTDTNFKVAGSSDATKLARFEVDGFTTATTRVVTLPNADIVVAGSAAALTTGRVPFATTGGLLIDSASLTWNGSTLAITGAATISTTLGVTGLSTLTGGLTTPAAITSTLATGTAPFTVASTTVVGNLNVSQLLGGTWAIPGTIGSTTKNTGAFTTLTANGATTLTAGTASTTTGTGTLVVTGGLGVSGALNAGGNIGVNAFLTHSSLDTDRIAIIGSFALTGTYAGVYVFGKSHASLANMIFYDGAKHSWRSATATDWLVADGSTIAASLAVTMSSTLAVTGATTINAGNAQSSLTLGNVSGSTSVFSTVKMGAGSSKYSFLIGVQNNLNNAFEITPSTATGGSTYSTPAFTIAGATGFVALAASLIVGASSIASGTSSLYIKQVSNAASAYGARFVHASSDGDYFQVGYDVGSALGLGTNSLGFYSTQIATYAFAVERSGRVGSYSSLVCGTNSALATNATDGFLYLPSCAGTPSGTPTAITGKIPLVYDSTNNFLYVYSGGAWKKSTVYA